MVVAQIQDVGTAFMNLLSEVILFIPRLVTFLLILLVGYIVARVVRTLLAKGLRALHFDNIADRAGVTRALELAGTRMDAAEVLGVVAFWWIFLVFAEIAVSSLGLTEITAFVNSVLAYLPNIFVAILILIIGALLANVVAGLVRGAAGGAGLSTASLMAEVARWAILIFAFLAALTQLNVAQNMIFILAAGIIGMLAIAGGLALGLGGADTARGLIAGWAMGRMLQPGQRVQIGQQVGTVIRHDMSTTVVDTGAGQISIPNASLIHEQIVVLSNDGRGTATTRPPVVTPS
ncbi:MAG: mechanosensitive ion channel family protein [Ktedonobacterales bacterium]